MRFIQSLVHAALLFGIAISSAMADSRGLLFRATLNGNTMLLYGTAHLVNQQNSKLDSTLDQAMARATSLSLEIHPDDKSGLTGLLWQSVSFSDAPALKLLSELDQARLDRALRKHGISAFMARHMNTFMLVALLTSKELELKGYDSKFNPDAQLLKLAKQRGLPVYGLERTEDQAAIFAKISPEQQAVALSAMLGGFEDGTVLSAFTDSIKLWEQADEAGMAANLTKEDAGLGGDKFMLALGPDRNKRMAEKCYAMLKSGDGALVSVGAAHLLGKDSVLALLAARGVKVERVGAPAQPLSGSAF